jgi:hypothetical protein
MANNATPELIRSRKFTLKSRIAAQTWNHHVLYLPNVLSFSVTIARDGASVFFTAR